MPKVHLIDASIYVFRAYYSVATEFVDHDGQPVHAVFGFHNMLLNLLDGARPSHLAVCFDESLSQSFRNALYPPYKANRDEPPADLSRQFDYCRELCRLLGLCVLSDLQFEADDLVGSALQALRGHGFDGVLVTGDKDFAQLVDEHTVIVDPTRNERFDAAAVKRKHGVRPDQFADYLALTGDAVDNIPGVRGVGPKTAVDLLRHFDSLDQLLARIEEIPYLRMRGASQLAQRLRAEADNARMFRQLTTIATHAPVPQTPEHYRIGPADQGGLTDLLDRLRFGPITRRRCLDWASAPR
ncbi:MAG: 5'-3' exonuclease H3TH domain-containing protein [Lysobacterales bacterium]